MVDGPRVHSEKLVPLDSEDRVQYRGCDVGRSAYAKQALEFHRAPILFHPFVIECSVLLEANENDTISRVKVYHDGRHHDTQHS